MAAKPAPKRKRAGRPPAPVRDPITGAIDLDKTAERQAKRKEAIAADNAHRAQAHANKSIPNDKPLPPREFDNRFERSAYEQARVEQLLRKGFTDTRTMSQLLDIPEEAVIRHRRQIFVRWEALGSDKNFARARGELIDRYNLIIAESFTRLSNEDGEGHDPRNATALLSVIKQATDSLAGILGVTPKAVEKSLTFSGERSEVISRMQKQDKLTEIAVQFAKILKEQRGNPGDNAKEVKDVVVIDGDAD